MSQSSESDGPAGDTQEVALTDHVNDIIGSQPSRLASAGFLSIKGAAAGLVAAMALGHLLVAGAARAVVGGFAYGVGVRTVGWRGYRNRKTRRPWARSIERFEKQGRVLTPRQIVLDHAKDRLAVPTFELYERQGRVLTRSQQMKLGVACVSRGTLVAVGAVGTVALVKMLGHEMAGHTMATGASPAAGHLQHISASHAPTIAKILSPMPQIFAGWVGATATSAPLHLLVHYRRRRIACKVIDGERTLHKWYGRWYQPQLAAAVIDEVNHRAEIAKAQPRGIS